MKLSNRLVLLGGFALSVFFIAKPVYAECGGQQQCIAVSINPLVAPAHGTDLTSAPVNFGSQAVGTTSTTRVILVAGVGAGSPATLSAITLGGANAAEFSITGGACSVGTNLPHGGAACDITIAFNPASDGTKNATVSVSTTLITRVIPLVGTAGYPDVAQDINVAGMLAAQMDTAQRFATVQIVNFQQRMESLHRGAPSTANASSKLNVDAGSNVTGSVAATNLVSLLTTQSINLANLTDSGDATGMSGSANFWAAGAINFGARSAASSQNSTRFVSDGISLGFDRRFGEQTVLGFGLGFARDRSEIGNDGSLNRAQGSSIAVYGSYQPGTTFIDGLIGISALKFETQRYVSVTNAYARGNRDGQQVFGSLATGFEHRDNGLLVSPYARLDYSSSQLKQSAESGAGQFNLSYYSQTQSAILGALGVRAASVHTTSFGSVAPRIRVEYQHRFQDTRPAPVGYADQPGGTRYAVPGGEAVNNAVVLGAGNDFVMPSGARFGIDYRYLHAFSDNSSYAVLMQFSTDFDDLDLSALSGRRVDSFSSPLGIQVDAGYTFDDNVTRAMANELVDSSYNINLGKTVAFLVNSNTRLLLTGTLGSEKFYRYDGLSRLTGGVLGELQYRSSAEFSAPTFGIFARTFSDQYNSDLRDGYRYSTGLSIRQPVTDRISIFGALAHNQRQGKDAVFDNRDNSARLNLDYQLSRISTIYLGGEYRRGDVTSTETASGVYGGNNISVADDAFPSGQLFSYRLDGATVLTTLGYNLGLGSRDSFDFSWRHVRSALKATGTPGTYAANATPNYTSNLFSVAYLVSF